MKQADICGYATVTIYSLRLGKCVVGVKLLKIAISSQHIGQLQNLQTKKINPYFQILYCNLSSIVAHVQSFFFLSYWCKLTVVVFTQHQFQLLLIVSAKHNRKTNVNISKLTKQNLSTALVNKQM